MTCLFCVSSVSCVFSLSGLYLKIDSSKKTSSKFLNWTPLYRGRVWKALRYQTFKRVAQCAKLAPRSSWSAKPFLVHPILPRHTFTCLVHGGKATAGIVILLSVRLLYIVCCSHDGNAIPWPMLILRRKVTSDTNALSSSFIVHILQGRDVIPGKVGTLSPASPAPPQYTTTGLVDKCAKGELARELYGRS